MPIRKKASYRKNKQFFSRTANRTRIENVNPFIPRGGNRK